MGPAATDASLPHNFPRNCMLSSIYSIICLCLLDLHTSLTVLKGVSRLVSAIMAGASLPAPLLWSGSK